MQLNFSLKFIILNHIKTTGFVALLKINRLRAMQRWSRVFRSWELFKRLSGLSPVAIELYGYVAEHCDWRNGRYVATSAEVANALSVTVRSVQRANKELEAAELIRFKRGIYAVNPEFNWGEKLEYFKVLLLLNGEKNRSGYRLC